MNHVRLLVATIATSATVLLSVAAPAHSEVVTGSLGGTLTNAAGVALADVPVTVHSTGGVRTRFHGRTDAAGAYTVAALPPGVYKVQFSFDDTLSSQWAHQARDEATATPFTVGPGEHTVVDESTLPTGSLSVTFRSRATGELIDVFCVDSTGYRFVAEGCTDTGTVVLTGLPAGRYSAFARADGFGYGIAFAEVVADRVTEVTAR